MKDFGCKPKRWPRSPITPWLRLILDAHSVNELSVAEHRYQAVSAVIGGDGLGAAQAGCPRHERGQAGKKSAGLTPRK
jgi:hypothetical protein